MSIVPGTDALPVYPLPAGAALSSLDYFPFYHSRFFGSHMYAAATNEEIGAALALWAYALGTQSPGGTLPLLETDLAHAARCWRDMGAWERVRGAALRGWSRYRVETEKGEPAGERLGHPVVTEIAVEMWRIKDQARRGREVDLARKQLGRLRAMLRELGFERQAKDDAVVYAVRARLQERGLPQSKPDVREAILALRPAND
ncbi:hypothetical protein [uncultured Zoogloea sp.]|uniref:hypothetical protein n=1 Tax=uncultured Zoogloea sp. TaxID=160237 RepID=UPI002624A791|nr:hypothetical protein [uncultured Zoogloea sp.]